MSVTAGLILLLDFTPSTKPLEKCGNEARICHRMRASDHLESLDDDCKVVFSANLLAQKAMDYTVSLQEEAEQVA